MELGLQVVTLSDSFRLAYNAELVLGPGAGEHGESHDSELSDVCLFLERKHIGVSLSFSQNGGRRALWLSWRLRPQVRRRSDLRRKVDKQRLKRLREAV